MILIVAMIVYSIGAVIIFDLWRIDDRSTKKEKFLAYVSSVFYPITLFVSIMLGIIEFIQESRK